MVDKFPGVELSNILITDLYIDELKGLFYEFLEAASVEVPSIQQRIWETFYEKLQEKAKLVEVKREEVVNTVTEAVTESTDSNR